MRRRRCLSYKSDAKDRICVCRWFPWRRRSFGCSGLRGRNGAKAHCGEMARVWPLVQPDSTARARASRDFVSEACGNEMMREASFRSASDSSDAVRMPLIVLRIVTRSFSGASLARSPCEGSSTFALRRVGPEAGLTNQLGRGSGHRFQMDVAVEFVFDAQAARDAGELLHRVVRALNDAGAEEQAFDVVAAVKI